MTCDICSKPIRDRRAHVHPGKRPRTPEQNYARFVVEQERQLLAQMRRKARA